MVVYEPVLELGNEFYGYLVVGDLKRILAELIQSLRIELEIIFMT